MLEFLCTISAIHSLILKKIIKLKRELTSIYFLRSFNLTVCILFSKFNLEQYNENRSSDFLQTQPGTTLEKHESVCVLLLWPIYTHVHSTVEKNYIYERICFYLSTHSLFDIDMYAYFYKFQSSRLVV